MKSISKLLIGVQLIWVTSLTPMNVPIATGAMTNTLRFERISLEEGLSQATINAIWQDSQGYMWFGTEDGLNKYDGAQFTVYEHDPEDPLTLSDSYISVIYEDKNGVLWVGTRSGLDRFDRTTGTFTHFQHDPDDPDDPLLNLWIHRRAINDEELLRLSQEWEGPVAHLPLLPLDPGPALVGRLGRCLKAELGGGA